MYKRLLVILISLTSMIVLANENAPLPENFKGIHIVPLTKNNLPQKVKIEVLQNKLEEDKKGYQESFDNTYFNYLFNLNKVALAEIESYKNADYQDTHLKSSFSKIKLAFPFKNITDINEKDVIGFAAIGTFVNENDKNKGWTGIREFFNNSKLGVCTYSYVGIEGVQMLEETTEYIVNKKPSNKIIVGNYNTGFVYTINWYTNETMSTLDCANKNLDKHIIEEMIVLANKIDSR